MTASTIPEDVLRMLRPPRRNRYFYGKLLDVGHFQMEQCYGLDKRWLLNRLALGSGVLCGLTVTVGADGTVCISPGVAIDGLGREIVVSAPVAVPPAQPTDDQGLPSGDPLSSGQSTLYLCYTECDADPALVSVAECDGTASVANGTTMERFRLVVRAGVPAAEPPALTPAQRDAIFPAAPGADFDRRVVAEQALAITCTPPNSTCVVVATVTLPSDGVALAVDQFTYRAEVFSNTVLFELIAALVERVDACCAAMHPDTTAIAITDGDAQSATVGQPLPAPVHLLVSDADANPAAGKEVRLTTTDADATLSVVAGDAAATVTTTTGADGDVTVRWQLGTTAGAQQFVATLTSNGAAVTVHATGTPEQPPPHDTPPVVVAFRPENASQVDAGWLGEPQFTVSFDQGIDPQAFANPDAWFRVWFYTDFGQGETSKAQRLKVGRGDPPDGDTTVFRADAHHAERVRVIVMIRGHAPEVVSAGPQLALDADFAGTRLDADQLERLWVSDEFQPDHAFVAAITDGGGTLPSGDGTAGGDFHLFFGVGF